ncbi:putative LOB domain-containing family protein [Hordeum vulgare]|nr:putative LOB domain-containing family protein [Hordeum vulgare]
MSGSSTSVGVGVGAMLSGSSGGPCGACKFLRRKCTDDCIFAPYFDSDQGVEHFTAVHKVFGASNVSKLLNQTPPQKRLDAAITICYEAKARLRDPAYGCVADIFALQQQMDTFIPVKFTEFCHPDATMPFGKELVQITKDLRIALPTMTGKPTSSYPEDSR